MGVGKMGVWNRSCPGEIPSAIRAGAGEGLCSIRE